MERTRYIFEQCQSNSHIIHSRLFCSCWIFPNISGLTGWLNYIILPSGNSSKAAYYLFDSILNNLMNSHKFLFSNISWNLFLDDTSNWQMQFHLIIFTEAFRNYREIGEKTFQTARSPLYKYLLQKFMNCRAAYSETYNLCKQIFKS